MFKIGQTSGVCTCCKPDAKPINSIKSYIDKMTKGMQDLPCACKAKTHVVQIAKGVFPCNKEECSSKVTNNESSSSCCGGGGCCGGSSCCGGGSSAASSTSISSGSLTSGVPQETESDMPDTSLLPKSVDGGTTTYYDNISKDTMQSDGTYDSAVTVSSAAQMALNLVHAGSIGIAVANDVASDVYKWNHSGVLSNRNHRRKPIGHSNRSGVSPRPANSVVADIATAATSAAISSVASAVLGGTESEAVGPIVAPPPPAGAFLPSPPSTIREVLDSSYPQQFQDRTAVTQAFKTNFCDLRPYPECESCQYASQRMKLDETDLYALLSGIQVGLDALNRGNVKWAEKCFLCPGQLAALLKQELGPLGEIVGPAAAAAIISATAVHGALNAYGKVAHEYRDSDMMYDLKKSIGKAICSGGCPPEYVGLMNSVLDDLGVNTRDLFTSGPNSSVAKIPGRSGDLPSSASNLSRSQATRNNMSSARARLAFGITSSDGTGSSSGSSGGSGGSGGSGVSGSASGGRQGASVQARKKAETTRSTMDDLYSRSGDKTPSETAKLVPTSSTKAKMATSDITARSGVTYYRKDTAMGAGNTDAGGAGAALKPGGMSADDREDAAINAAEADGKSVTESSSTLSSSSTNGEGKYEPIAVNPGENLSEARAKYGNIFTDEEAPTVNTSGLTPSTTYDRTNDTLGKEGKTYYKSTGTGSHTKKTDKKEKFSAEVQYSYKDEDKDDAYIIMTPVTEDVIPADDEYIPGVTAIGDRDFDVYQDDPYVYQEIPSADITDKVIAAYEEENDCTVLEATEHAAPGQTERTGVSDNNTPLPEFQPLVFDNGFVFEQPVPMDSTAYEEIVVTPNLVTVSGIPASEMAQLSGIGLSVDEIKMAYVLDSVENGSTVPWDVNAELIPTILDTFLDGY